MAVNLVKAGHAVTAAGALQLAEAAGVNSKSLFDIVSLSAGSSWMLNDRGPCMQDANPEVRSAIGYFRQGSRQG